MCAHIRIKSYNKWADIALNEDPLMEVARTEGKHFSRDEIKNLLKRENVPIRHVKTDPETYGCMESIRFNTGDQGFAKFIKTILNRDFYPRGGCLTRLYQRTAYAKTMARYWESTGTFLLKNLKYVYQTRELEDKLESLKRKYLKDDRENLLLAVAVHAILYRRSRIRMEEDSELNSHTSNTDDTDSDSDDDDDQNRPGVNVQRKTMNKGKLLKLC